MGPNRTFQMILQSHRTQIDLLISSWLTLYSYLAQYLATCYKSHEHRLLAIYITLYQPCLPPNNSIPILLISASIPIKDWYRYSLITCTRYQVLYIIGVPVNLKNHICSLMRTFR